MKFVKNKHYKVATIYLYIGNLFYKLENYKEAMRFFEISKGIVEEELAFDDKLLKTQIIEMKKIEIKLHKFNGFIH